MMPGSAARNSASLCQALRPAALLLYWAKSCLEVRALGTKRLAGLILMGHIFLAITVGCGSGSGPGGKATPTATLATAPAVSTSPPPGEGSSPSNTAPPNHRSGLKSATLQSSRGLPWQLVAEEVEWNDPTRRARALKVEFTLWDMGKQKKTLVAASGADVDVDSERVEFQGRVTAIGPEGESLTVNRLVWDGKERQFFGDRGVRVERAGSVVEGERLIASPDLRHFEIVGGVRGVMQVEEGPES